jgi:hypothetical protein
LPALASGSIGGGLIAGIAVWAGTATTRACREAAFASAAAPARNTAIAIAASAAGTPQRRAAPIDDDVELISVAVLISRPFELVRWMRDRPQDEEGGRAIPSRDAA